MADKPEVTLVERLRKCLCGADYPGMKHGDACLMRTEAAGEIERLGETVTKLRAMLNGIVTEPWRASNIRKAETLLKETIADGK